LKPPKFNAFNGVFVPTFLSIIGVILFLRLGFIVGNASILPSVAIILLAVSVTLATALSLSSITTNIRIGSGGVYSIISKTLGLEVGGSVGAPLYLALILSTTLYLFGFTEAWQFVWPEHPTYLVLLIAGLSVFVLTYFSTRAAVRLQTIIFVVIVLSLVSFFGGVSWLSNTDSTALIGDFRDYSFWGLFALFFPAVTGVMAGLGLSGELEDPKRQIPIGIISATVLTAGIYLLAVIYLGFSASSETLINDSEVAVNLSSYAPLVILGILVSTYSSALTTFIAAPRLLSAMGEKNLFPGGAAMMKTSSRGIPQTAVLVSALLVGFTLAVGNLNAVAPFISMFFLLTYAIINIVVFLEQSMGLVNFRPTLSIPRFISLYGAIASLVFIFFINVFAGVLSIGFMFVSYIYLVERRLPKQEGDLRSGLFTAFSEWAAKKVLTLPESSKHTWKPSILLPVIDTRTLLGNFSIIKSVTFPNGTMTVLGLDIKQPEYTPDEAATSRSQRRSDLQELPALIEKFGEEGIFTSTSNVVADNYTEAVSISLEAIEGQTFPPNILYLPFKPQVLSDASLSKIIATAQRHQVGVVLSDRDPESSLGSEEDIHIWLPAQALKSDLMQGRDYDLALLLAFRLYKNWAGSLSIYMCVDEKDASRARTYINKLLYEARLPQGIAVHVSTRPFEEVFKEAPRGDIHLVPITGTDDTARIKEISAYDNKSIFFVMDSGKEDILA
jgi:amino acid transporter